MLRSNAPIYPSREGISGAGMTCLLAIETSCDETSAAVLRGYDEVLAHKVHSQMALHERYGGVVPEVASRSHLEALPRVVEAALRESGISPARLDAFAATVGPGLAPALLVGASAARGMAAGAGRPFLAINHIEGHLLSPFFGESGIPPHAALVVSGGHTLLVDVGGFRDYRVLGRALDDAAGEAFDKFAKMLGLGYPGGAEISRLAATGDASREPFPRAMRDSGDFHFSFSGLKTAARYRLEKGFSDADIPHLCAGFQEAIAEVLVHKLTALCHQTGRRLAAISGGVSANARLAELAAARLGAEGIELRIAKPELRTDNALMIACVAAWELARHRDQPTAASPDIFPNFQPETFPYFT